jgi:hypothetical protein
MVKDVPRNPGPVPPDAGRLRRVKLHISPGHRTLSARGSKGQVAIAAARSARHLLAGSPRVGGRSSTLSRGQPVHRENISDGDRGANSIQDRSNPRTCIRAVGQLAWGSVRRGRHSATLCDDPVSDATRWSDAEKAASKENGFEPHDLAGRERRIWQVATYTPPKSWIRSRRSHAALTPQLETINLSEDVPESLRETWTRIRAAFAGHSARAGS